MESTVNPNRWVAPAMNGHYEYTNAKCEVFYTLCAINGKSYAMGFSGKRSKADWHYSFGTAGKMYDYIEQFQQNCLKSLLAKQERAEQKKANDNKVIDQVKVGQIYANSWGYDQTNVDFYQVTEVKGKTATLHKIGAKSIKGTDGFMCCNVTPDKDNFIDDPCGDTIIKKRIQSGYRGVPSFSMQFGSLSLTHEGASHYCSWYA